MTVNVGTADIALKIDRAKLSKDIDKAGREVDDKFGKVGEKAGRSFMESARKYSTAGGLVAGASLLAAKGLADAASDQAEALNKARVVFGEYSGDVEAFANKGAKALGMSKTAALEYTGTLGNLLLSAELLPDKAAEMSTTLVQLAADMASFNNSSPEEALEALRSGLSGETEPLKRFGVNLNDATLKQEALNLGIYDGTGVLTANQKAQAAYSVILKQTTTAQGDFARTSDGAANKQRVLKAQIEDQKAAIGEGLLPAYSGLLGVLGGAAEQFAKLPPVVSGGALALTAMGGAALFLTPKIVDGAKALKSAVVWMKATTAAGGPAGTALTGVGTAAAAAAAGLASFSVATAGLNKVTNAYENDADVEGLAAALELLGSEGVLDGALADNIDGIADSFRNLDRGGMSKFFSNWGRLNADKNDIEEIDDALKSMVETGNVDQARAAYNALFSELTSRGVDAEDVAKRFDGYWTAVQTATVKARTEGKTNIDGLATDAEDAATRAGTAWDQFYDKLSEKDAAVDKAGSVFQQLFGGNGVDEASSNLVDAQRELAAGLAENGNSFDIQTEAGRKNRENLQRVRDAQLAYLDALLATGNYSKDELHFAFQSVSSDLFDVLRDGGATADQMEALRDELRLTPAAIEQAFNTAPIDDAIEKAREATRALFETIVTLNRLNEIGNDPGYYGAHGYDYDAPAPYVPPEPVAVAGSSVARPPGLGGRSVVINQKNYGISPEAASRQIVRLVRAA